MPRPRKAWQGLAARAEVFSTALAFEDGGPRHLKKLGRLRIDATERAAVERGRYIVEAVARHDRHAEEGGSGSGPWMAVGAWTYGWSGPWGVSYART